MRPTALLTLPLTFIILPACGDQVPPDYRGEPLAVIQGYLHSQRADPLPEADIAFGWPDWSKLLGDTRGTYFSTFTLGKVSTTLPARFTISFFAPPPETAYSYPAGMGPSLAGPRITSASILLVKHGMLPTSSSSLDPAYIASFAGYRLSYIESDGVLSLRQENGALHPIQEVKKGFQLLRQDITECVDGYDESCIAQLTGQGLPDDEAWPSCTTNRQEMITTVPVPLDEEITLTVTDPKAPRPRLPICANPA